MKINQYYSAVLVAVGSYDPYNIKSEKFEDGNWSDIEEPPVSHRFFNYVVIFDGDSFYYFGGFDRRGNLGLILRLSAATFTWSNIGKLNSPRNGHGVTLTGSTFMVIGGRNIHPNEACTLNNGEFTCEEQSSTLNRYAWTPLLFHVSENFVSC